MGAHSTLAVGATALHEVERVLAEDDECHVLAHLQQPVLVVVLHELGTVDREHAQGRRKVDRLIRGIRPWLTARACAQGWSGSTVWMRPLR